MTTLPPIVANLTLVDVLFLLAAAVVVPLGLRSIPLRGPRAVVVLCTARIAQPFGALAALLALLLPTGWVAGAIALGWLAVCAAAALAALVEVVEVRSLRPRHLAPPAALAFLAFGALWFVLARTGLRPEGFAPIIVELTAVHFHYAGFAATLMGSLTAATLAGAGHPRAHQAAEVSAVLLMLGTPMIAAAIATGSGALTVVGPIVLAVGVLATAALMAIWIAPRVVSRLARWCLWISAASVVVPMVLGVDYALSRVFPSLPHLDIPTMALIHGDLNAVFFTLLGLLGWTVARRAAPADALDVA